MDVRGATGVQIGDNTQMHLHLRGGLVPWWTRSGYIEQVRDIAPGRLMERDGELAELAAFCAGDAAYLWFRAGPWAGKSALLSTFVLNPPPDVDVVAFFVTARLAAQSDSTAFTDALLDQLSAIVGESVPASLTPATRDAHRRALLRASADRLLAEGRRLVLVVDGLDEDRGCRPGSGLPSVASLLPRECGDGLRVVVAGRPGTRLPDDVPAGHPLHGGCQVRDLAVSRHASRVAQLAGRELLELLHGDPAHVDIIGLITAAGGGLTVDDLQELTGLPPYRLEGLLGRPFGRTVVGRAGPPATYLFAHEVLRETAIRSLGSALDGLRDRLHVWAGTYRLRGWPPETPPYLLRGYARMLTENGDLGRLAALAADPRRHDRMLSETGGDAAALSDIRAAAELAGTAAPTEENLCRLAQLSHHREQLERRNDGIPTGLPAVWARLGRPTRAEALAHSIPDPQRRARALAAIARPAAGAAAVREAGDLDHALRAARGIAVAARRERALAALVAPLARAGRAELAEKIARGMTTPGGRANQLAGLAWTLAAIGETGRAERVALDAERTARDAAARHWPSRVRAELVRVLAVAGEADRAERIAQGVKHPDWRPKALATAAAALAAAGEIERAERLSHAVGDAEQRVRALAELVRATTKAGDDARALRLAGDAERIARGIGPARGRAAALTGLLGATGDAGQARRIAADVELIAGHIDSDGKRAAVLTGLAGALAAAGEIGQARRVAAAITSASPPVLAGLTAILPERAAGIGDPYWQARGLAAAAAAGTPEHARRLARDAERIAGRIATPAHRAMVLIELARTLAAAGAAAQSRRLAADAERIADDVPGPDQRARVLAELARVAGGADTYRLLASAFAVGSWLTPLAAAAETCPRLAVRIIDAIYEESSSSAGGVRDQLATVPETAEGSSEK